MMIMMMMITVVVVVVMMMMTGDKDNDDSVVVNDDDDNNNDAGSDDNDDDDDRDSFFKELQQILTVCELVLKQMTIITMSMIAIVIKSTHESSLKPKLVTCPFAFHPPACI